MACLGGKAQAGGGGAVDEQGITGIGGISGREITAGNDFNPSVLHIQNRKLGPRFPYFMLAFRVEGVYVEKTIGLAGHDRYRGNGRVV